MMDNDIFDGVSGGLRNFLQGAIGRRSIDSFPTSFTNAPGHDEIQASRQLTAAANAPYGSIAQREDPTNYGSVASRQMPGQFGMFGSFNPSYLQGQKDDLLQQQQNERLQAHTQSMMDQGRVAQFGAQQTAAMLSPMFQNLMNSNYGSKPPRLSYASDEDLNHG